METGIVIVIFFSVGLVLLILYIITSSFDNVTIENKSDKSSSSPKHIYGPNQVQTQMRGDTPVSKKIKSIPFYYFIESSKIGGNLLLQDSIISLKTFSHFEAMLFTSAYILIRMKNIRPQIYSQFEPGYYEELQRYAVENNVLYHLKEDSIPFFKKRIILNSQEIGTLSKEYKTGFVPLTSVVYNIFDSPLNVSIR